ncbi:ATP-binding protein [Salmonella enterica subsp. salamae]|nr:ATP-binding protein [Salmonella enterica subsp. salamae]
MSDRRSEKRFSNSPLSAAHRGYVYQDLVTAYLFICCLVRRDEKITVDRKTVEDDRFDDIEVIVNGHKLRRQLKSSENITRPLTFDDFDKKNSSLRFDRLVNTFLSSEEDTATEEYRLCATWQYPDSDDPVVELLIPANSAAGTFDGYSTELYYLDPDRVWSKSSSPVFKPLVSIPGGEAVPSRDDVIAFCERFIIEIAFPAASLDLEHPGPLENLLLKMLVEHVGIGRYPNDERRVEDVAALAVHIANVARTRGESLSPSLIAQRLSLRTDFGRIAQAFPLDRAVLFERKSLQKQLFEAAQQQGVHLILAGPGAGKSWSLTQLSEELVQQGFIVARHYCFLEPGDELVERRITTNVFFANLLAELHESCQKHAIPIQQVFSSGIHELEQTLGEISTCERHTVIIVDGLDHIARVRDASLGLSDNETDIVEQLATLELPERVTLIIGSQPGKHLEPLREVYNSNLNEYVVESWSFEEVRELAIKLGLGTALAEINLQEKENDVIQILFQRSEGNPLYTRYLCFGLMDGLLSGAITEPFEWLIGAPDLNGDIKHYYGHLYSSAGKQAQAIADLMGVMDFSITESELCEIVGPLLRGYVSAALQILRPVLTQATTQGGMRIFHESFRRFMIDELVRQGRHVADILYPVAVWLETRGFFVDAKSYRFLLPIMRRAGRDNEILTYVSASFVRESVAHGHPSEAIQKNIMLATDVAARTLNWPALVRYAELSRALNSCFEEGNNDWQEYWRTYYSIYGADALAERLLFDGRPTLTQKEGLLACQLVDSKGVAAPWQEYLSITTEIEDRLDYSNTKSHGDVRCDNEEEALATIYGALRLGRYRQVIRHIYWNLCRSGLLFSPWFLRNLAQQLAQFTSPALVERICHRGDPTYTGRYKLPDRTVCLLFLGLSDFYRNIKAVDGSRHYAEMALCQAVTPIETMWCVDAGASGERALDIVRNELKVETTPANERYSPEAEFVHLWVASVRLKARDVDCERFFQLQRLSLEGDGWYRCWLRFVLAVALAEAAAVKDESYDILAAFEELTKDTRPFVGSPRACDLYLIHPIIKASLVRALKLLKTREEWEKALSIISMVRNDTTTYLDRDENSPLSGDVLYSFFLAHTVKPEIADLIIKKLEDELESMEANGTYYSVHALERMKLAQLYAKTSPLEAIKHWQQAIVFLLSYGFRKDITLFDIIECVPALRLHSRESAIRALISLRPLLSAVLCHTDHRTTKHAPNAWFSSLLQVDEVQAIELLNRTLMYERGVFSWTSIEAQKETLRQLADRGDSILLNALWSTLLADIDYENAGEAVVKERLSSIQRLLTEYPAYAQERFTILCAEVFNDSSNYQVSAVGPLRKFAEEHSLHMPAYKLHETNKNRETHRREYIGDTSTITSIALRIPVFPPAPKFVELLTILRKLSKSTLSRAEYQESVSLPLSYIMTEMVQRGEEEQALRLLYFFVHERSYWSLESITPVLCLAECLDNSGHEKLAVVAYTLAFTSARGGRGWLNFGDDTQSAPLRRALEMDKKLALQTLAQETLRRLNMDGYYGLSRHLIERIADWGDHELAVNAWEEAFTIIESRLPLPGQIHVFENLELQATPEWSLDESLCVLLLTNTGNAVISRRIAALSGVARLVKERTELFYTPLKYYLMHTSSVSSLQSILQILNETLADVTALVQRLKESLRDYAQSPSLSLSLLAKLLLSRIKETTFNAKSAMSLAINTPSNKSMEVVSFADESCLLNIFQEVWPELPTLVATRMESYITGDAESVFKHFMKERYELKYDRGNYVKPSARTLLWHSELFLAIFDNVLTEFPAQLWRKGLWEADIERNILGQILPFMPLHLAMDASRIPRPDWPLYESKQYKLAEFTRVSNEDPTWGGWIRLGLFEQYYFRADGKDYGPMDRKTVQCAAIVRTNPDGMVPPKVSPLGSDDALVWWEDIDRMEAMQARAKPQLVKLDKVKDWLDDVFVLLPPAALKYDAQLKSSHYAGPLCWYDENGQPVVVLRTWRVKGKGTGDIDAHVIIGADLIMHPKLEKVLHTAYGGPLKELNSVHCETIS